MFVDRESCWGMIVVSSHRAKVLRKRDVREGLGQVSYVPIAIFIFPSQQKPSKEIAAPNFAVFITSHLFHSGSKAEADRCPGSSSSD